MVECNIFCKREKILHPGMMDTRVDFTILTLSEWPSNWELQAVAGMISGIGGVTVSMQSKFTFIVEGPEGKMATIRPYVIKAPITLWGRTSYLNGRLPFAFLVGFFSWSHCPARYTYHPLAHLDQWFLSNKKLCALEALVEEQLSKGHIFETPSPWNSHVFVFKKPGKAKWRLLHDLRKINETIEDMGPLQPGLPSPSMLP